MAASADVTNLPFLGSGLGYRTEIREAIFAARESIDFVELLTDQFISDDAGLREVREVCSTFRAIPHGIGLSVGSSSGVDREYLNRIKRVSDLTSSPYYSEHLCMTRAPGLEIGHLVPLAFTEEVLRKTIRNVREVQEFLGKPLILENVTYLFDIPQAQMGQPEFFSRLVEETGCGVLLDVTNVYINSVNHAFDSIAFLDSMPLESVVHVHIAGGYWSHEVLIDSHSEIVQDETWALLEALSKKTRIRGCVLEHDSNFPENIAIMLAQVTRARTLMSSRKGAA